MRTRFVVLVVALFAIIVLSVTPILAQEVIEVFPDSFNDPSLCGEGDIFSYAAPSPNRLALATLHWDSEFLDPNQEYGFMFKGAGGRNTPQAVLVLDLLTGATIEIADKNVSWTQPTWKNDHVVFYGERRDDIVEPYEVDIYDVDGKLVSTETRNTRTTDYIMAYDFYTKKSRVVTEGWGRVAVHPNGSRIAFLRKSTERLYQSDIWIKDMNTGAEWRLVDEWLPDESIDVGSIGISHEISVYNLSYGPDGTLYGEIPGFSLNHKGIYQLTETGPVVKISANVEEHVNGSLHTFTGIHNGDHDINADGEIVYQVINFYDDTASIPSDDDYVSLSSMLAIDGVPLTPDAHGMWTDKHPFWYDANRIVFVSDRQEDVEAGLLTRTQDMFVVDIKSGELTQVTCTDR